VGGSIFHAIVQAKPTSGEGEPVFAAQQAFFYENDSSQYAPVPDSCKTGHPAAVCKQTVAAKLRHLCHRARPRAAAVHPVPERALIDIGH